MMICCRFCRLKVDGTSRQNGKTRCARSGAAVVTRIAMIEERNLINATTGDSGCRIPGARPRRNGFSRSIDRMLRSNSKQTPKRYASTGTHACGN
jgi:hypothetical protein